MRGAMVAAITGPPHRSRTNSVFRRAVAAAVVCLAIGGLAETAAAARITNVRVVGRGAQTATVAWTTNVPATTNVEYGLSPAYGLWTGARTAKVRSHRVRLKSLLPGRRYHFRALSRSNGRLVRGPDTTVTTTRMHGATTTRVGGRKAILLNGHPIFPILQWLQCPGLFGTSVALGVNAFMGKGCENSDADEVAATGAQNAFSILPYSGPVKGAPSLLGWYGGDEPDMNGIRPSAVKAELDRNRSRDPRHVNFLTLTGGFSEHFDAPDWMNGDRSYYTRYARATDVVGFDVYPIYGWCRPDWIRYVADAERELARVYAPTTPTYAWIEAVATSSQWCTGRAVRPGEVRAEVWMAIANGAKAIGYFTHSWTPSYSQFRVTEAVRAEMRRTDRQISALGPAILGKGASTRQTVRAGGRIDAVTRTLAGARYVLAVNVRRTKTVAQFSSAPIANRRIRVFEEGRTIRAGGHGFSDTFGPLAVHLYVVPPAGY